MTSPKNQLLFCCNCCDGSASCDKTNSICGCSSSGSNCGKTNSVCVCGCSGGGNNCDKANDVCCNNSDKITCCCCTRGDGGDDKVEVICDCSDVTNGNLKEYIFLDNKLA
ncbi:662_t:CDS:2 [Racocetra fulgida]|uniref:662_t:CDS:1 n=1 Tax=Racocetra fulgida TaxID=60492 RepID=A0A9N9BMY8_9GLOM|nr:662_t:CDS:2 [Racocetra fulgida]